MKNNLCLAAIFVLVVTTIAIAQTGVKKRRSLPYEFGRVVLNNFSEAAGQAPVVFDHWLHRAKFTCRLCHVDIGFAMQAGNTRINAADNMRGYYCGSCHNGKTAFKSCTTDRSGKDAESCDRCHSSGKEVAKKYDFKEFTRDLPRGRFGNGVDWEKAEVEGKIKLSNFLEGVSIPRNPLLIKKDFGLEPKVTGIPGIIFSHKKHTAWSGCELCHPEIFLGIKKGTTQYSMVEIYNGRYCGACHGAVAFPLLDCQRCHTEKVQ